MSKNVGTEPKVQIKRRGGASFTRTTKNAGAIERLKGLTGRGPGGMPTRLQMRRAIAFQATGRNLSRLPRR